MNTYMSTPGNTAKLGAAHSNTQTAQSCPSLVGIETTIHINQHTTESAHYPIMPAKHKNSKKSDFSRFIVLRYVILYDIDGIIGNRGFGEGGYDFFFTMNYDHYALAQ